MAAHSGRKLSVQSCASAISSAITPAHRGGRWYQTLPLATFLESSTGTSGHFSLRVMGLGMQLGTTESHDCLMLPDSAVTAWPLAHATLG